MLIAEVDCSGQGKQLCDRNNVETFPALKYGDASSLEFYDGPRHYADLLEFAEKILEPFCSPSNRDSCYDEKLKLIEEYEGSATEKIQQRIREERSRLKQIGKEFRAEVARFTKAFENLMYEKENKTEEIKSSLRRLQAIHRAKEKGIVRDEL